MTCRVGQKHSVLPLKLSVCVCECVWVETIEIGKPTISSNWTGVYYIRQGGYVFRSVGLFVCQRDYGKPTGLLLMKLYWKGAAWAREKPLNFGADRNGRNSLFLFWFAVTLRVRVLGVRKKSSRCQESSKMTKEQQTLWPVEPLGKSNSYQS